jgi:ribose-phosphate pyrophosphokinase
MSAPVWSSVHAFAYHEEPARRLATALGADFRGIEQRRFPDGESLVRTEPDSGATVIYCSLDHPNDRLFDLLLAASALRDSGARSIVLVAPYLCYMRQDVAFQPGEAVSQRVVARILSDAFDGLVTVDPHLHRAHDLNSVFSMSVTQLSAAPLLGRSITADKDRKDVVLVGPDWESRRWVETAAKASALDVLVGRKVRLGDRDVAIEIAGLDRVRGRTAVLIDDVVSSGSTVCVATRHLLDAGADRVELFATHMLSSETDTAALYTAGVSRIVSTDSVRHATNKIHLASLLAEALRMGAE